MDQIAAYHDICCDMGKNKGDCDKQTVKSLDQIPYGKMPKIGSNSKIFDKYQKETRSRCEVKKLKKPSGEEIRAFLHGGRGALI